MLIRLGCRFLPPGEVAEVPAFRSLQEALVPSLEMSVGTRSALPASLEMRCLTCRAVSTLNVYNSSVWSLGERSQTARFPELQLLGQLLLRFWHLHSQLFKRLAF